MTHLEALSRLGEPGHPGLQAHLKACADCRAVAARWRPAPSLGFSTRIMAELREEAAPARPLFWAPALMGALALLLVVGAFWRPERVWVHLDQGFAYSDKVERGGS